jgi:16S rRNA (cytosine967-C5)-methyltransferase
MNGPDPTTDPRRLAVRIVDRVFRTDSYADILLDSAFRNNPVSEPDKALATELVYGTLRWWKLLDWNLSRVFRGDWKEVPEPVRHDCEIALYQILFLDRVPAYAAVDAAVRMAGEIQGGRWKATVNAVLRTLIRGPELTRVPDDAGNAAERLSIIHSHPTWLVEKWIGRYGEERTASICRANNERPGISLRINRLRSDRAAVVRELEGRGIPSESSRTLDEFISIRKAGDPSGFEGFRQGRFTVQDVSAGLVAHLIDPHPGDTILDMAAAPGGKTTAIAELSEDRAVVTARDINAKRLALVTENTVRLGLQSVRTEVRDGRTPGPPPEARFDKVLVDAPCSGLGTLRRRPELKWRRKPGDIPALTSAQSSLLDAAAGLLRPGGILVYSTCTVLEEENRGILDAFLTSHREFEVEDAGRFVPSDCVTPDGTVETWPDIHGSDGSFAVRMNKMESSGHESV